MSVIYLDSLDSLDREGLERLFTRIGAELVKRNLTAEITIYGGSALMLQYGLRTSTKDVDVVMDHWDESVLREITSNLAREHQLDQHWFNDDVRDIVGDNEKTQLYKAYPSSKTPAFKVFIPNPEYMLALQVRALASAQLSDDASAPLGKHAMDVRHLVDTLGFNKKQTVDCVKYFFPNRRLPPVVIKWLDVTFDETEPALA